MVPLDAHDALRFRLWLVTAGSQIDLLLVVERAAAIERLAVVSVDYLEEQFLGLAEGLDLGVACGPAGVVPSPMRGQSLSQRMGERKTKRLWLSR